MSVTHARLRYEAAAEQARRHEAWCTWGRQGDDRCPSRVWHAVDAASIDLDLAVAVASEDRIRGGVAW